MVLHSRYLQRRTWSHVLNRFLYECLCVPLQTWWTCELFWLIVCCLLQSGVSWTCASRRAQWRRLECCIYLHHCAQVKGQCAAIEFSYQTINRSMGHQLLSQVTGHNKSPILEPLDSSVLHLEEPLKVLTQKLFQTRTRMIQRSVY